MELKPIGRVSNAIANRKEMTAFGVPSVVEILPAFEEALFRIEKHSHIWVIAWIDRGERDVLQVTPRGGDRLHGVFSVRSPARPNPIGLTAAKLVERRGLQLEVDLLDFIDGTVVLDIKPYFPPRDMIFSSMSGDTGKSKNPVESLELQIARFHGSLTAEGKLAAALLAQFREDHGSFSGWVITAPLNRPQIIDAVMAAARVSVGRGTLRLSPGDSLVFEKAGQRVVIPLTKESS